MKKHINNHNIVLHHLNIGDTPYTQLDVDYKFNILLLAI